MLAPDQGVSGFQTTHIGSFLAQALEHQMFLPIAHPPSHQHKPIVSTEVFKGGRFLETAWRKPETTEPGITPTSLINHLMVF